jgi:arsenate reductase
MEVWFNPSCSKSRKAVAELEAAGITPALRRYLDHPPTEAELERLLDALGLQPWDVARTGEAVAADVGLADLPTGGPDDRARWIRVLVANPILIQRPILVASDGTAHVGRDDAGLAEAIDHETTGHETTGHETP